MIGPSHFAGDGRRDALSRVPAICLDAPFWWLCERVLALSELRLVSI